jgi:SAM-dependent methyltransferase
MNFERLAPHYDWLEAVTAGGRLQRARTHWLDQLAGRRRILSVGEGHGRFAAACLARFPEAELTCVEASPAMLALARRRNRGLPGRVHWECAEVLAWQPVQRYDAIVTCFFLDCFPPDTLAAVIGHLATAATADAVWLLSDFDVPLRGPARWRAQAVHALMYAFFRAVAALPARSLAPPDAELQRQGFELTGRRHFEWGLLRAEVWRRRGVGET